MNREWPKKMPVSVYAKRWYTSRTKESVINDIKRGHLPGEQEHSGQWFVWVNADDTPAHNYSAPTMKKTITVAGNRANEILARRGLLAAVN